MHGAPPIPLLHPSPAAAPLRHAERVVVVDDSPADRDLHCLLMRSWGLQPVAAADGWEGLVCTRTLLPALVVTDLRMPGLDGWGLIQRMRDLPATERIPVMLVTGMAGEVSAVRARAAGVVALLAKPLDLAAFRRATESALPPRPAPPIG